MYNSSKQYNTNNHKQYNTNHSKQCNTNSSKQCNKKAASTTSQIVCHPIPPPLTASSDSWFLTIHLMLATIARTCIADLPCATHGGTISAVLVSRSKYERSITDCRESSPYRFSIPSRRTLAHIILLPTLMPYSRCLDQIRLTILSLRILSPGVQY